MSEQRAGGGELLYERRACITQEVARSDRDGDHAKPTGSFFSFLSAPSPTPRLQQRSGGLLSPSPCGTLLAVVCPTRRQLAVLAAEDNFSSRRATFAHHGTAAEQGTELLQPAWAPDSRHLLVPSTSGLLWLLEPRSCSILATVDGRTGGWRGGLTGAVLLIRSGDLHILALSTAPALHLLLFNPSASTFTPTVRPINLRPHHRVPHCLAFDPSASRVLVAGDGPSISNPDAPTPSTSSGSGKRVSLSVWRLLDKAPALKLVSSSGPPGVSSLFGGLLPKRADVTGEWNMAVSPSGLFAAVTAAPAVGLRLFSLEDASPVDPLREFSGLEAEPTDEASELVTKAVSADWWDQRLMSVSTQSGKVTVVTLPGMSNVLAGGPIPAMSPGTKVAVVGRRVAVLEPVMRCDYGEENKNGLRLSGNKRKEQESEEEVVAWKLVTLEQRSPEEMLYIHVRAGAWESALTLADSYGLDTDVVHKARWESCPVEQDTIRKTLSVVRDRGWVVSECFQRVASSADAQAALLEYGLEETQQHCSILQKHLAEGLAPGEMNPTEEWMLQARLALLRHRERLAALTELLQGGFEDGAYSALRDANLLEAASHMASTGNVFDVQVLLSHFQHTLYPYLLDILGRFPETLDPLLYKSLLPAPNKAPQLRKGQAEGADWAEGLGCAEHLAAIGRHDLLYSTEALTGLAVGSFQLTPSNVVAWYSKRVRDIEAKAGQVSHALTLARLGLEAGADGDEHELSTLKALLTELEAVARIGDDGWSIELADYEAMPAAKQLQLLLKGSTPANIGEAIADRAVPFAHRVGFPEVGGVVAWLLEKEAEAGRLDWCVAFLSDQSVSHSILFSDLQVVDLAVRTVYACRALDQWDTMDRLLNMAAELLPGEGRTPPEFKSERDAEMHCAAARSVEAARGHVHVGRLLAGHGASLALEVVAIRELSPQEAARHIRALLAATSRSAVADKDATWTSLWRELKQMQATGLQGLERSWLMAELCRALLRAGRFGLAKSYLHGSGSTQLPPALVETLVMNCGREYLYSAPAIDSRAVADAATCFRLLPDDCAAAAQEMAVIALLRRLPSLGLSIAPMEYHQMEDKLAVVEMVLEVPGSHRKVEEVLELAAQMGLTSTEQQSQVIAVLAEKAANSAAAGESCDAELAIRLGLQLVESGNSTAWELCARISELVVSGDGLLAGDVATCDALRRLLAFATAQCPPDQIGIFAGQLREVEQMAKGIGHGVEWGRTSAPSLVVVAVNSAEAMRGWGGGADGGEGSAPRAMVLNTPANALALCALVAADEGERPADVAEYSALGRSYEGGRLARMLGMAAECWLALHEAGAAVPEEIEKLLSLSAAQLLETTRLKIACTPNVTQEAADALAAAELLAGRMSSAAAASGIAQWMSSGGAGINQQRFAAGDRDYQQQVLLQLAQTAAAGNNGETPDAEKLEMALKLATQYDADTWQLRAAYVLRRALASGVVLHDGEVVGGAQSEAELLQRPAELLELVRAGLAEVVGSRGGDITPAALANLLAISARCWQAVDSSADDDTAGRLAADAAALSVFSARMLSIGDRVQPLALFGTAAACVLDGATSDEAAQCLPHPVGPGKGGSVALRSLVAALPADPSFVAQLADLMEAFPAAAWRGTDGVLDDKTSWLSSSGVNALAIVRAVAVAAENGGPDAAFSAYRTVAETSLPALTETHATLVARWLVMRDGSGLSFLEHPPPQLLASDRLAVARDVLKRTVTQQVDTDLAAAERRLGAVEAAREAVPSLPNGLLVEIADLSTTLRLGCVERLLDGLLAGGAGAPLAVSVAGALIMLEEAEPAVQAVLQAALAQVLADDDTEAVYTLVGALDERHLEDVTHSAAVARLREGMWAQLESEADSVAAAAVRRELLLGAAPRRWGSWSPPGGNGSARASLLRAETVALIGEFWQHDSVQDEDLASADSAAALVSCLLSSLPNDESPTAALLALGEALVTVWHGGSVWGDAVKGGDVVGEVSALGSSWTALLLHILALPATLPQALSLLERGAAAVGEAVALVSEDDATAIANAARQFSGVGGAVCVALALPHDTLHDSVVAELANVSPSEAAQAHAYAPLLLALLLRHADGTLPCLRSTPVWQVLLAPLSAAPIAPGVSHCTTDKDKESSVAAAALLPWLLAELVMAGQLLAAGGLLLERAKVHTSLRSPGAGLALLQRYLFSASRTTAPQPRSLQSTTENADPIMTALPTTAMHLLRETPHRCADARNVLMQNLN